MSNDEGRGPAAQAVRSQLGSIVAAHGPEILDDSRRVRAILADSVSDATAESNLIGLALSAGVATGLRAAGGDPGSVRRAVADAVADLQRTSSVQARDAQWAVSALADALGLQTSGGKDPSTTPASGTGRPGPGDLVVRWADREVVVARNTVATIGRDPDSTIVVDAPSVSRRHARIRGSASGWTVEDLVSTQGTFIGGVGVTTAAVAARTELQLGQGRDSITLVLAPFGMDHGDETAAGPPRERLRPAVAPLPATTAAQPREHPGPALGVGGAPRTELGGSGPAPDGADLITVMLGGDTRRLAPGQKLTVGREADLAPTHPTASRRHALVEHRQGRWHLVDQGTTSGTWLDGARVTDVTLGGRQEFVIGDRANGDRLVTQAAGTAGGQRGSARRPSGRSTAIIAGMVAAVVVVVLAVVLVPRVLKRDDGPAAAAGSKMSRNDLARATVYLEDDDATASGVIIDKLRGLVLTNAHFAAPSATGLGVNSLTFSDQQDANPKTIDVAVSAGLDRAAEPMFTAHVVAFDGYLDFAVLKLDKRTSGALVSKKDLEPLSQVRFGNSDRLRTSDKISYFGYPAAASSKAPTFTTGNVSGLEQDDRLDTARAIVNTTAASSFGNSGGLAFNTRNEMVGVPTYGLPDANGQVVLSGFRPINLAKKLIQAARTAQAYSSPYSVAGPASAKITSGDLDLATPGTAGQVSQDCATDASEGAIAFAVNYSGFPTGQHTDVVAEWLDGDGKVVAFSQTQYPTPLSADGCMTLTFDQVVPPGRYKLKIGVGGDLRVIWNEGYKIS